MKVILVNGSPHQHGCTYTALAETAKTLEAEGIEAEIFWIKTKPISGCTACGKCSELNRRCIFEDVVNEFLSLAENADGIIIGSPVHYSAASGAVTSFLDRAFYSGGSMFRLKPGAAIVVARRAGTTAALDQLNKYFTISQMPIISSCYWNNLHGTKPEDIYKDEEGMCVIKTLAKNMAWFLKCKQAGEDAGIALPDFGGKPNTNFIR